MQCHRIRTEQCNYLNNSLGHSEWSQKGKCHQRGWPIQFAFVRRSKCNACKKTARALPTVQWSAEIASIIPLSNISPFLFARTRVRQPATLFRARIFWILQTNNNKRNRKIKRQKCYCRKQSVSGTFIHSKYNNNNNPTQNEIQWNDTKNKCHVKWTASKDERMNGAPANGGRNVCRMHIWLSIIMDGALHNTWYDYDFQLEYSVERKTQESKYIFESNNGENDAQDDLMAIMSTNKRTNVAPH